MIVFKELSIVDFMSIREVNWEFKRGINLCLGRNLDSASADDNGSGKSTLADALRWVLFGESIRQAIDKSLATDSVIREGQKSATVTLRFMAGGEYATITRVRGLRSGKLMVKYKKVEYTQKEAQAVIDDLIGIDAVQYSNLVHLDASYPKLFTRSTDRDRKDILAELVDVSYLSAVEGVIKNKLSVYEVKKAAALEQIRKAEQDTEVNKALLMDTRKQGRAVSDLIAPLKEKVKHQEEAVSEAKNVLLSLEKTKTAMDEDRVKALKEEEQARVEAQKRVDEEEASRDDVRAGLRKKSNEELKSYHLKSTEIKDRISKQGMEISKMEAELQEINQLLSQGKCPVCRQDIDADIAAPDREGIQFRLSEAKEAIKQVKSRYKRMAAAWDKRDIELEEEIEAADSAGKERVLVAKEALNEILGRISSIDDRFDVAGMDGSLVRAESNLESAKKELASLSRELNQHVTRRKELKQNVKILSEKIALSEKTLVEVRDKIESINAEIADLSFWKQGFGPKGVPSLYLEMILPKISAGIQRYADILTDGDIQVGLRAYKETKSGSLQEAIQIIATNSFGASVYGSNSRGERCRIDLAVTLGLMDYFKDNNVFESNLLICDEIFDGLDSRGVELAVEALEEANILMCVVMSHNDSLKSFFDHVMVMTKEHGVSSLGV